MKKQDLEFIDLPAGKAVRIKEPSYAFALIIKDLQNDGKFALVYPHALMDNGQPDLKFMICMFRSWKIAATFYVT